MLQTLKGSHDFQGVICQPQQTSLWKKMPELIYTYTVIAPKVYDYIHQQFKRRGKEEGKGEEVDC